MSGVVVVVFEVVAVVEEVVALLRVSEGAPCQSMFYYPRFPF